ncbi:glycosyltransferase family 4 protein [Devosia sp. 1566]|uniref:glycosyltransferase family 4 protein n=1 Tax=Devosia sp. 1566 TaxID=2499144 RepID=UPI000FD9DCF8|nr:glycosyltransferase family 4 protein [Devosia sp. 1566]
MLKNKTLLFIHQNFPGQFKHLVRTLVRENSVYFISKPNANRIPGVKLLTYKPHRQVKPDTHAYLRPVEDNVLHGQAVARILLQLKQQGITPDLIIGHSGWGETLFAKDIFPDVPLLSYFEFYFHTFGSDVNFDPAYPGDPEIAFKLRLRNQVTLSCLESTDQGLAPTWWQQSQVPKVFQGKMNVVHEGVDTVHLCGDNTATVAVSPDLTLSAASKVVTYVARNLEPYRGFHIFMQALPGILEQNPDAHVVVVGAEGVSYGAKPADGKSYKDQELAKFKGDLSRVHIMGRVEYDVFKKILQISSAHIYLTYPFVLSWSMLEAMSCQCLVIGSATPPVEEVIQHGVNGMLVDFFDHNALVKSVTDALTHPDQYTEIRRAARQTIVDHYDLHRVCLPRQKALLSSMTH